MFLLKLANQTMTWQAAVQIMLQVFCLIVIFGHIFSTARLCLSRKTSLSLSLHSACPTLSFPLPSRPPLRPSRVSLRLEWWFRPHCEVSNPIQRCSEREDISRREGGGEVGLIERGIEMDGWETERDYGCSRWQLHRRLEPQGQFGSLTCPPLYLLHSCSNLVHGPLPVPLPPLSLFLDSFWPTPLFFFFMPKWKTRKCKMFGRDRNTTLSRFWVHPVLQSWDSFTFS